MNDSDLFDELKSYAERGPVRFHMPGHKGMLQPDSILASLAPYDVTELSCTDDLNAPSGVIKRLEGRAAGLYQARFSLILVNGSTSGNIAMLLSLGMNKKVLVARNCHKSVLSGIALAGHEAVSIIPDSETGLVSPQEVEAGLNRCHADAVFITSPTYYGLCSDVDGIAAVCHRFGAKLFVDAAHGAHFPFSDALPNNPSASDAWVVSCHKTLNAYTQSAILNIGYSNDISAHEMQRFVSLVQTSSPSYLLMLSVENAIDNGGDWNRHCSRIVFFRRSLQEIEGVELVTSDEEFDITRVTVSVHGYSGYELQEILEKHGVFVEMADLRSVVLITTPSDPSEWYCRFLRIIKAISVKKKEIYINNLPSICNGETGISIREAMLGKNELVALDASAGRISAQAVGIYPPGIATLFPGEVITNEEIDYLKLCANHGAKLFGAYDERIIVYKEEANR